MSEDRVAVLIWRWGIGGAEVVAYYMIKAMLDMGIEPYIYTISGRVDLTFYEKIVGEKPKRVKIVGQGYRRFALLRSLFINRIIDTTNIDTIINTHGGLIPYIPHSRNKYIAYVHYLTLLRNWAKIRFRGSVGVSKLLAVGWSGYYYIYKYYAFRKILESLKKADHIIVNSSLTRKVLSLHINIESKNVDLIHPPVPNFDYLKSLRHSTRKPNTILVISRFSPERNLELAVTTLKSLDNYELIIAGTIHGKYSEAYINKLKKLIKKLDIHMDRIKFIINPSRSTVLKLLGQASIYLSTTIDETFGISIAEAAIAGLPVVVSSQSGFYMDICKGHVRGCYGYKVPSPEAIADLIKKAENEQIDLERLYMLAPSRFIDNIIHVFKKHGIGAELI